MTVTTLRKDVVAMPLLNFLEKGNRKKETEAHAKTKIRHHVLLVSPFIIFPN